MVVGRLAASRALSVGHGALPGETVVPDSDLVTVDDLSNPRSGSTPHETYRATLTGRTPTGAGSTLIVTRQGVGGDGRVWLTFDGAIKATVVMTDPEAVQLRELIGEATRTRT